KSQEVEAGTNCPVFGQISSSLPHHPNRRPFRRFSPCCAQQQVVLYIWPCHRDRGFSSSLDRQPCSRTIILPADHWQSQLPAPAGLGERALGRGKDQHCHRRGRNRQWIFSYVPFLVHY